MPFIHNLLAFYEYCPSTPYLNTASCCLRLFKRQKRSTEERTETKPLTFFLALSVPLKLFGSFMNIVAGNYLFDL